MEKQNKNAIHNRSSPPSAGKIGGAGRGRSDLKYFHAWKGIRRCSILSSGAWKKLNGETRWELERKIAEGNALRNCNRCRNTGSRIEGYVFLAQMKKKSYFTKKYEAI